MVISFTFVPIEEDPESATDLLADELPDEIIPYS